MIETDGYKFYTLKEAQKTLDISSPTIRDYIRKGKIKAAFMFGRWYISEVHLREYMERASSTATNTAAAIRATNPDEKEPSTTKVYAVGVHEKDVTAAGIPPRLLKIIPMEVTAAELDEMQKRNFYVYTSELYATQILEALRRDGFQPERVPVFDPMEDHSREEQGD